LNNGKDCTQNTQKNMNNTESIEKEYLHKEITDKNFEVFL